jgi:hypothetical protein
VGILGDSISRRARRSPGTSSPTAAAGGQLIPALPLASTAPAVDADGRSQLRRRRDALAEQVTELHWDLGGLAYEMAIRDHFRLDVLVRRAALLQERDAELAEVERLLRLEDSASAGSCPRCAAPHSRGALFCWQCGATLMERAPSAAAQAGTAGAGGDARATAVMDARLAPDQAGAFGDAEPSDE